MQAKLATMIFGGQGGNHELRNVRSKKKEKDREEEKEKGHKEEEKKIGHLLCQRLYLPA
jgi:hypothetical protein